MENAKNYLWDDRAPSFLQLGDVARSIAEDHAHIEIDDTTYQRWGQLMGLLREFDTMIDDRGISHDDALGRLRDFSEFRALYPALAPDVLSPAGQQRLLRRAGIIMHRGEQLARETSVDRFIALRVSEGWHTAGLFEDSATAEVEKQPGFRAVFMPTMRSLGATASLLDSVLDAPQDKRHDKLAIDVSREYYARLLGAVWQEAGVGSKALLHRKVLGQFAVMSATRLKNRLRHGRTPGSSLDIFFR